MKEREKAHTEVDSAACEEWDWQHDYDLAAMTNDLLENLSKKIDDTSQKHWCIITHYLHLSRAFSCLNGFIDNLKDIKSNMTYSKDPLKGSSVKQLEFLTGAWKGGTGEDSIEEHWMKINRMNMTGMFRWLKGDEVYIYELMALVERDECVVLYLRHFDKDFVDLEGKDDPIVFHLTEVEEKRAVFIQRANPEKGFISYELLDDTLTFSDHKPDGSVDFSLQFSQC